MKFIIKADDLSGFPGKDKAIPSSWQKFIDITQKHKVKATIGIIGCSLIIDDQDYFDLIKRYHDSGLIEFWNHGLFHMTYSFENQKYHEFNSTSLNYQYEIIQHTQNLAYEKLGFEFKTFGAPFNQVDINTVEALNKTNLTHAFFLDDRFKGKNISKSIPLEKPVRTLNIETFNEHFEMMDYAVLQVHPNGWNEKHFEEFEQLIGYLKDKGEFIKAIDFE
jgi:peptidoglycan/xylan/chitin deacetylase (PgdA/CDA1 family)